MSRHWETYQIYISFYKAETVSYTTKFTILEKSNRLLSNTLETCFPVQKSLQVHECVGLIFLGPQECRTQLMYSNKGLGLIVPVTISNFEIEIEISTRPNFNSYLYLHPLAFVAVQFDIAQENCLFNYR